MTARVGRALGIAVAVCFVTGLISHVHQHPADWFPLPPYPEQGYRVTQGLHVATGLICIPLVLVKLFSVYPLLLRWPPARSPLHALERLSIAVLVSSVLFQLITGVLNIAQWYPWPFFFTTTHYAIGWVLIGSVLLHLAIKAPVIVGALRERLDDDTELDDDAHLDDDTHLDTDRDRDGDEGLSRRGLLTGTAGAATALTLLTVGETVPGLGPIALLSPRRPDIGPQNFPVTKTAAGARVREAARAADWALTVAGPTTLSLTLDDLQGLTQHEIELPIACVEGWSASAVWGGLRLSDLLERAGIDPGATVRAVSLEKGGLYRTSTLSPAQAWHPHTLLAMRLRGESLAIDHGYPLRLISPNRPGVLQTKWLDRVEVV